MALVCSGRFRAIVKTIGKEVILPNLRLTDVHGQRDDVADRDCELLRQVVRSRLVQPEDIEPEALDDVITMSGGVALETSPGDSSPGYSTAPHKWSLKARFILTGLLHDETVEIPLFTPASEHCKEG